MKKELSYHNDATLKKDMVEEMAIHKKQDAFIKGTYGHMNGQFKGCAVGCGIHSLNVRRNLGIEAFGDHAAYSKALGIPEWLARLEDTLFENLPKKEANNFPLDFVKAMPIGVDLEPVKWRFCALILKENIERVLTLKIKDDLKQQVVESIQGVLKLHETAIDTGKWDESAAGSAARSDARSAVWSAAESAARSAESAARSAESAAGDAAGAAWAAWAAGDAAESAARSAESAVWSAARSAAESAAWSAVWSAESAAWSAVCSAESAAWSAARSAAWIKYSKELLRLLKTAK